MVRFATTMQQHNVYLEAFRFHQRARNLSPATIRVARESLSQFLAHHDPTTATKHDVQRHLSELAARCRPATVWTAWRHLVAFVKWIHEEGAMSPVASAKNGFGISRVHLAGSSDLMSGHFVARGVTVGF